MVSGEEPVKVLGAMVGEGQGTDAGNGGDNLTVACSGNGTGATAFNSQFEGCTRSVAALHEAVGLIGDPAVELVLTRRCADACKVTHLLRAGGDVVED